jgi:hypothetical protein
MKPILFLDVDGVLNVFLKSREELHPNFAVALVPAPGVKEFIQFARENFDVRWLSAWSVAGYIHYPEALAWLTGLTVDEVNAIPAVRWPHNKATAAIKTASDRPWVWLEDGISKGELYILKDANVLDRYIYVNSDKDSQALAKATEELTGILDLYNWPLEA